MPLFDSHRQLVWAERWEAAREVTAVVLFALLSSAVALWWLGEATRRPMVPVMILLVVSAVCTIARVAGGRCAVPVVLVAVPAAVVLVGWLTAPTAPSVADGGPPMPRAATEEERVRDARRDLFGRLFVAAQPTLTPRPEDMAPPGSTCVVPGWTPPDLPGERPRTWGPPCTPEQMAALRAGDPYALVVPGHEAGERWAAERRAAAAAAAQTKYTAEGVPFR